MTEMEEATLLFEEAEPYSTYAAFRSVLIEHIDQHPQLTVIVDGADEARVIGNPEA
jgi:hypothetical protein